jgi:hypothetical protein
MSAAVAAAAPAAALTSQYRTGLQRCPVMDLLAYRRARERSARYREDRHDRT